MKMKARTKLIKKRRVIATFAVLALTAMTVFLSRNIASAATQVDIEEAKYQYNYKSAFSGGMAVVKKNGKYGYVNKNGEEVIKCQYDEAVSFLGDLAFAKKDGIWYVLKIKK